jgi:hypothetical protein
MVVTAKGGGAGRRQRDAPLVRLYLGGHSDNHVEPILSAVRFRAGFPSRIFDAATARASHKTSNGIPQELDKRISAGRDESTWT